MFVSLSAIARDAVSNVSQHRRSNHANITHRLNESCFREVDLGCHLLAHCVAHGGQLVGRQQTHARGVAAARCICEGVHLTRASRGEG